MVLKKKSSLWDYFASLWVVILATFSDTAKKARPHANVVNSIQIEGRTPWNTVTKSINGKRLARICAKIAWILL